MRDEFVAKWENQYQDKYLFEKRDGVALARMMREHPEVLPRWSSMVDRYLGTAFWAEKNHPLVMLATRPGEFAASSNGTHTLPNTVRAGRDALSRFMTRREGPK